jgi:phospholipid/cholesterol/gamma-HCH transport system permease protein
VNASPPPDSTPAADRVSRTGVTGSTGGAAALGGAVLGLVASGRALVSVFMRTLYFLLRGTTQRGAVATQMYEIGNRSLVFLCVVMGFIGMIFVYQTGLQTKRVVPDLSLLGATYLELLVRDLAATICALMLATRVGAGIAAEIGSMVVTEQVDALRMCAADPIDYLLKPRFVASVVMTTMLVVLAAAVATGTGMYTGYAFFDINPRTFLSGQLLDVGDVTVGLCKCVAYGAAIPVISGYCGLTAFGGSEGVGQATTRAVVNSSLAVIMLDFLISGAGFLVFG